MTIIFVTVIAYLIGSLPVSFLWGWARFRHRPMISSVNPPNDPLVVLGIQVGKGVTATTAGLLFAGWAGAAMAAIAAVVGEVFSVFRRFQGGDGAVVAAGALLVLSPILILLGVVIYGLSLLLTRYFSLSTMVTAVLLMVLSLVLFPQVYVILVVFAAGGLVLYRHWGDFGRWKRGLEIPFRFKWFR
ncbi:glycerol-3-phosphate acyltransferase [Desmospora profundinema]|uniref:Glycerol-3-phosphate acyltransferase PlsY n=1 Tax=Desmospora profundinema TaxID=1571184 RepID=A0ABU1IP23_9BACL|nr:glycerol-3-phosphate acyltransferase [Desmospora profundinema]MDR6225909.1 glycerol-3-phosphate acyltransferase PlsY [Desmospora profundinema]